tara:strand:+ start:359 stop:559 length:201 start_codon:yes stop_codon:yes gene_type:complete
MTIRIEYERVVEEGAVEVAEAMGSFLDVAFDAAGNPVTASANSEQMLEWALARYGKPDDEVATPEG